MWSKGQYLADVGRLIASNTRAPLDIIGDMQAQAEATRVAEQEIVRLADKYGVETIKTAFAEVQDYVEKLTRQRISKLPDGVWETEDYIDVDPAAGEGLVPIRIKLTIEGDHVHYDLSKSHPKSISTFLNSCFGGSFAAIVAGTKMQFPDIPLNSGFYRVVTVDLGPTGSVVNASWPTPVAGFCSGPFEKIMNCDLRALGRNPPGACDGLHLQSGISADRGSRRASTRIDRTSCGTTGWSAAGVRATDVTAGPRAARCSVCNWAPSLSRARSACRRY